MSSHSRLPCPQEAQKEEFHWDPDSKAPRDPVNFAGPFHVIDDPQVFSVVNAKPYPAFTYLTFLQSVVDRHGARFEPGLTRSDGGKEELATNLGRNGAASPAELDSDAEEEEEPFGFPLPDEKGPYLCTQGVGGHLTHFFPESYHAIDLRCANHTPVLSIGAGVVKEICQSHKCGGIHAANLAKWNSISVLLSCGLIVDYLHVMPGCAQVQVGDHVQCGQVLGESGDIGFAPEPRLGEDEGWPVWSAWGPSVPVRFGASGFVPVAGSYYISTGEVPAPHSEDISPTSRGAGVPSISKSRRRLQRLERQKRSQRSSQSSDAQSAQRQRCDSKKKRARCLDWFRKSKELRRQPQRPCLARRTSNTTKWDKSPSSSGQESLKRFHGSAKFTRK
eukprot:g20923.t1